MNVFSRGIASLALRWITGPRAGPEGSVDPARFGIPVKDPAAVERIRAILTAFFGGFEWGMKSPGALSTRSAPCPPLLQPFFHEGFAMGLLPNGFLRLTPARTSLRRLEDAFGEDDPFLFLRYVGIGFWLGFQHPRSPGRVDAFARRLRRPKYRHLLHDGYGFKVGFFARGGADRLRRLDGFAREAAFSGFGRSLWFFTMDRPEQGFQVARSLGPDRDAVLGGMGLAAAFTFSDDLARAYGVLERLSGVEGRSFHKGIRIALFVRATADPSWLSSWIDGLPAEIRARAGDDVRLALEVGNATRGRDEFIAEFHRGCLDGQARI